MVAGGFARRYMQTGDRMLETLTSVWANFLVRLIWENPIECTPTSLACAAWGQMQIPVDEVGNGIPETRFKGIINQ